MAQTTLPVRLLQMTCATRHSSMSKGLVMSILLVIGSLFTGCGSGEDNGDLTGVATQNEDGSADPSESTSVSLAWDPVNGVLGYVVHYGTHSPGTRGSCSYAHSKFSSKPSAVVTGLSPSTTYFFAVSSYNGLESACSVEVMTLTDPAA